MTIISGDQAYQNLISGFRNRTFRFPTKQEGAYEDGLIFPKLAPKFSLNQTDRVFTIGSCFAREIEFRLSARGVKVPVLDFKLQPNEFPHPDAHDAHILNEYNAGTILQRLESCFGEFEYGDYMGLEEAKDAKFIDLFLHIHSLPVTFERLIQRRDEIKSLYEKLLDSEVIVITLGLIEAWFDSKFRCFLNKAPSRKSVASEPTRFLFHRMEVSECLNRLNTAIELINRHSSKKILITVSPIPMEATFSGVNAVMANSYSKSVLRVVAQQLVEKFDNVDYFPSFEIALSAGNRYFQDDNVHVSDFLGEKITMFMLKNYMSNDDLKNQDEFNTVLQSYDSQYLERIIIPSDNEEKT